MSILKSLMITTRLGICEFFEKHIYIRISWGLYTLKITDHIISLFKIEELSNKLQINSFRTYSNNHCQFFFLLRRYRIRTGQK